MNKNKFLSEYKLRGKRLSEVNQLIYDWQKDSGIAFSANEVNDTEIKELKKAIEYKIYLLDNEAEGFKNKENNRTFHKLLRKVITNNESIDYFAILCPSYKKGIGATGFSDVPGNGTHRSFNNLITMRDNTLKMGIKCTAQAFFADISVESYEKLSKQDWEDFEQIIKMDGIIAKAHGIDYKTLTDFAPELIKQVGRKGKLFKNNELVNPKALERAMWRDRQFYPMFFGWNKKEAEKRSLVHAQSYHFQGVAIRKRLNNPIMVYTAYDYEKGGLYNGIDGSLLPAMIYPIKDELNRPETTLQKL